MTARLILAATPIGNTDDASPRLRELLATAPVIAAEDTRKLRDLTTRLGLTVTGTVVAHHEHNETHTADQLLDHVDNGLDVVVVTDAGMPVVSDPGYRIVERALERGIVVTAVPGPSAVVTALAVAGLPTDRFTFEGFVPRKPAERRKTFAALAAEQRTMVFFEATHRVAASLDDAAAAFGPTRRAALCRELTKTYEEVVRAPLGELASRAAQDRFKGEIVLVVAGAEKGGQVSFDDALAVARERVAAGERTKDAASAVAKETGVSRRELYEGLIAEKS